jgi:hypothetical protein
MTLIWLLHFLQSGVLGYTWGRLDLEFGRLSALWTAQMPKGMYLFLMLCFKNAVRVVFLEHDDLMLRV